ncbi:hypothetical protein BDP27DRAFT_1330754 [Rhodocollybia butyracea]|uniref:Uncharacterized protein n=1 Tax=Rhodocollybia butyracea TaxID=206335 RepID=A0A9P5U4U5_9AGAR|nr:hypothetical protein BDP27DRAFT_1330754 [Rhodocollybia butyracea]
MPDFSSAETEVLSKIYSLLEDITSPEKVTAILAQCAEDLNPYMAFLMRSAGDSSWTRVSEDERRAQGRSVLSTLLQKRSMPGNRTPLFHAIIQAKDRNSSEILSPILAACRPLTASTSTDIRDACIIIDNNEMFQSLRCSAEYEDHLLSDSERLFFSKTEKRDAIEVKAEISNSQSSNKPKFTADFMIPMFQQRMRESGKLELYFVAQGRMWCLAFRNLEGFPQPRAHLWTRIRNRKVSVPANPWSVSLSLVDGSLPTPVEATVSISPARSSSGGRTSVNDHDLEIVGLSTKPKHQLVPTRLESDAKTKVDDRRQKRTQREIYALFDSSVLSSGSMYITDDGSLSGKVEAILADVSTGTKQKLKAVAKDDVPDNDVSSVCL